LVQTLSDLQLLSNMKCTDRTMRLREVFSEVLSTKEREDDSNERPLSVAMSILDRILTIRSRTQEILSMWDTANSDSVSLASFSVLPKTTTPANYSRMQSRLQVGAAKHLFVLWRCASVF
jgi:hypothetical protein